MRRCDTSGMCSPYGGCQAPQSDQDRKIIALEATVAQQAKMIEHLRGGPTPLYTAVDMANAARDGFRDGAASYKAENEALRSKLATVHFVCDQLPGPDGCRFIELENPQGESLGDESGKWEIRQDGLAQLVVTIGGAMSKEG